MIVVTSGHRYIDIDAYACCIAYTELLNLLGRPAIAASTSPWNESITASLRQLHAPFHTDYAPAPDDQFVIVDLSDPAEFDKLAAKERVIEIFDHHPGFEQYWRDKLGAASHIESIGAAATQIYEVWAKSGHAERMSRASAELLTAAILDNTLNFRAHITTDRDKAAYDFLAKHAGLDEAWTADYFAECQEAILNDLPEALRNDTKLLAFKGLDTELCFGQLVVWDAKQVLANELDALASALGEMRSVWLANVVGISDGKSYFVTQSAVVKAWAEKLLRVV